MLEYAISYLFGSINFCWIIGKLLKIDISKFIDGNLGGTNLYLAILEIYKNKIFATIFALIGGLLDVLKAFIPTILFGPLAGAFAVIGHCFSVFSIIITKKIPSGVGEASTIGYLLATYKETLSFIIIYFILYVSISIFLKKTGYYLQRIHIYKSFGKIFSLFFFFILSNPKAEILYSLTIIIKTTIIARLLRLKNIVL